MVLRQVSPHEDAIDCNVRPLAETQNRFRLGTQVQWSAVPWSRENTSSGYQSGSGTARLCHTH